jgi:alkanesulfonate monooxygenase SsuD/methylene tetrahydromethanopterin reductase-like flavin-dependent oxidoreductase (luciferase family)
MLECYSALSYAAALTEKVTLGPLVVGVTYRQPALLVKIATALDVLSKGRSYFGVGAAWFEREHKGLGVNFPPRKERFERLEEMLQIAHQMWSGEAGAYNGQYYQLAEAINVPNSVQRPHPPIMIGGMGEQKTFRMITKYGDACNIFAWQGPESVKHKYDVIRERCDEIGRPYSDIEKTTLSEMNVTRDGKPLADELIMPEKRDDMTAAQAIEYFQQLAEIGTDHAIFNSSICHIPGALDIWAEEVIPAVHKMQVAGR